MIHYHGTPISPRARLLLLAGRSFCVSFARPDDVRLCHEIGESVMLDNGAYTFWRRGANESRDRRRRHMTVEWDRYYEWCERWLDYRTTWAVIPDVIDGDEEVNDQLIAEWPFGERGAPVWHMHEPFARLVRLAAEWPRVCLGSSAQYATVGTPAWHGRMREAMNEVCGNGPAPTWLHMLRGLNLAGSEYPFASADSTNVARNHNGSGSRSAQDPRVIADRFDVKQCPARWTMKETQLQLV